MKKISTGCKTIDDLLIQTRDLVDACAILIDLKKSKETVLDVFEITDDRNTILEVEYYVLLKEKEGV